MNQFLLSHSAAQERIQELYEQFDATPFENEEDRAPPDNPTFSTSLRDGQNIELLWIERFDAMFADRSLIIGEGFDGDEGLVPVAWYDEDRNWVRFEIPQLNGEQSRR